MKRAYLTQKKKKKFGRGQNITYSDSVKTYFTYFTRSIYSHNINIIMLYKRGTVLISYYIIFNVQRHGFYKTVATNHLFKSALQLRLCVLQECCIAIKSLLLCAVTVHVRSLWLMLCMLNWGALDHASCAPQLSLLQLHATYLASCNSN